MLINFLLLLLGLTVLYYGAEFLVKGASRVGIGFGISPIVVGLTIVAFATSAPEFVVSLLATLRGSADIAIGNVIGSNIANIALIIGVAAIIVPFPVDQSVVRRDYPFLVLSALLTWVFCVWDSNIIRMEGIALLLLLSAFLYTCAKFAYSQNREFVASGAYKQVPKEMTQHSRNAIYVVIGLIGLVIGAKLMVDNAAEIARAFDIPELTIGVTIIALGTSLPELATSVVAALKGDADISIGNIIGSCIFNLCFILGGVSLIGPLNVSPLALVFDFPASVLLVVGLFPLLHFRKKVGRIDGILLVLFYVSYLALTYLRTTGALNF